ncbi:MAG: YlxR family protein [Candidatus Promineifilaceae bacterium]
MMKKQGRKPKHVPQRTCVVCRQKTEKRRLIRIVRTPDDGVVVDMSGKQNGRGAYVCDRPECWDKMLNDRAVLGQALKAAVGDEELAAVAVHRPIAEDAGAS